MTASIVTRYRRAMSLKVSPRRTVYARSAGAARVLVVVLAAIEEVAVATEVLGPRHASAGAASLCVPQPATISPVTIVKPTQARNADTR
jgi:hypothetical protein